MWRYHRAINCLYAVYTVNIVYTVYTIYTMLCLHRLHCLHCLHCLHYLHCLNCLHRTAGSYFFNYKNTVAQNNEYFSCRATLHLSCLENKIQRRLADKQNTEQRKMMSQFTHALQHPHLNTFYHLDEFLNLYIYTYGNV